MRRLQRASRLRLDVGEQLVERLGELLDALALQRLDDVVVVDARRRERVERARRAVDVLVERVARPRRGPERLDGLARHRVDGVGADQLLDVEHVAVVGVLGRRRRPQAALRRRALGPQRLPRVAGEDLLVGLVGELGVGDRERALELVVAADVVEPLVGLGVDARDEERRDRRHRGQVAARVGVALHAADVGLGDLAVAVEREDQRHVDGDAGRDRLLDRRQARLRGRDLDEQVRAGRRARAGAWPPRSCRRCRARGAGRPRARPSRRGRSRRPRPRPGAGRRRRRGCPRRRARGRPPWARSRS